MIYTSYINYNYSNKLEKVRKLLRFPFKRLYFQVQIGENNVFRQYSWNTSNLQGNNTSLSNTRKGLSITLKKSNSPFYFVLNSQVCDFKRINFTQGTCTSDFSTLELCLHVSENNNANICSLLVMEYDRCFNRINTIRHHSNMIHSYLPSIHTHRIVICIEVKGNSNSIITGLTLKNSSSIDHHNGSTCRAKIKQNNSITGLPYKSSRSPIESINKYLEILVKERDIFSQESFKWKRRALEWEKKVNQNSNTQLNEIGYEAIIKLASSLPKSNGCHFHEKHPYKVGIISDIYMVNFYKDVFEEIFYLSPTNYTKILNEHNLDIILYVTGWKGIENEEWRGIKFRDVPSRSFDNIIKHAKQNNIKLVFQSIEDPSNFEYFLPIAKKFDHIFTSDMDMIKKYQESLKHLNVYYGEYGINPILNNPIASQRDLINGAFFAGSYPERYKERCKDMAIIFDSILDNRSSLIIADRNYNSNLDEVQFPKKYRNHIIPPIDHEVLQNTHKLFRFNINFNSIKNSPTMCAMRIYELQAQGTIIISNYAKSVFNKFPNIRIVPVNEDMSFDFSSNNELTKYKLRIDSVREVMTNKTSFDVVGTMLGSIGLNLNPPKKRTIAVLGKGLSTKIKEAFNKQAYKNKILLDMNSIIDESSWEKTKCKYSIDYFTWFNPENDYQKYYLIDLVNGFKYTNSHYITKNSFFKENIFHKGPQHEFTTHIDGIDKTLFRSDRFSPITLNVFRFEEKLKDMPFGYSIDPFELNYTNYLAHKPEKTSLPTPVKYILSIIIPVYNNSNFLIHKCIPSLQRNNLWERFEVILIDDGSSDHSTRETCSRLDKEYQNISTYFYPIGGSGSASRPRNKGIELASAELITFLDPDNEISPGGYDTLIELYKDANQLEKNVQFVSGYNKKIADDVKSIAKHTSKRISVISDFKSHYFNKGKFPTIATQAVVISKILLDNRKELRFVENSAGQDTLFGWELLLEAKKGAFTSESFLVYYADRDGSVTNTLDNIYFQKKLSLEIEQVKILRKHHLLNTYINNHFDYFMENWYLNKLRNVSKKEYPSSLQILSEICQLYGKNINSYLN